MKCFNVTKSKDGWKNVIGPITHITQHKVWVKRPNGDTREFAHAVVKCANAEEIESYNSRGAGAGSSSTEAPASVLALLTTTAQERSDEGMANAAAAFGMDAADLADFGAVDDEEGDIVMEGS